MRSTHPIRALPLAFDSFSGNPLYHPLLLVYMWFYFAYDAHCERRGFAAGDFVEENEESFLHIANSLGLSDCQVNSAQFSLRLLGLVKFDDGDFSVPVTISHG